MKGISLDGGSTFVSPPLTFTAGSTYTITGVDNVGNMTTLATVTVTQDTTPPSLSSLGAPTGSNIYANGSTYYTTSTSLAFSPTATDTGSGVKGYNLDGSTTAASYPLSLSAGSSHTIYAVDNVGNVATLGTVTVMRIRHRRA